MWLGHSYDYDAYDLSCYPSVDGYTILPTLLHPKSRGRVEIQSKNMEQAPHIQAQLFVGRRRLGTTRKRW